MRAAARASLSGLLLALLLVLVAVSTPAMSGAGNEYAQRDPAAAIGASVSAAQSNYDELHDRPRGSVTAGHASTTALLDTSWTVYQREAAGRTTTTKHDTR